MKRIARHVKWNNVPVGSKKTQVHETNSVAPEGHASILFSDTKKLKTYIYESCLLKLNILSAQRLLRE